MFYLRILFWTFLITVTHSTQMIYATPSESLRPIPSIFGNSNPEILYYHSHTATRKELQAAAKANVIFEIDLAWAHNAFHPNLEKGKPYIGHPEEFYTVLKKPFPAENITLAEFVDFLKQHPRIKVLLDIKDQAVFPYLKEFVDAVGAERCIAHAFIKNWTIVPENVVPEPHWYREDIDLYALNAVLAPLKIPLIANCRGFSDQYVEKMGLVAKMLGDAKKCSCVICLGLYYPSAPTPRIDYLKAFNDAGYRAWVNANLPSIPGIKTVGMCDDISRCTRF